MAEAVEDLCKRHNIGFSFYACRNLEDVRDAFEIEIVRGGSPLVHLDGHGTHRIGLRVDPSDEFLSFSELIKLLRRLNVNSGNNLVVVSAFCHGLQAILEAGILEPSPYFAYYGTAAAIKVGVLIEGIPLFYQRLLDTKNLDEAAAAIPEMALFNCQELLFGALLRYRRNSTMGRGARQRVDSILSQAKARGKILLNEPVAPYRRYIKERLKNHFDQTFLDDIAAKFLIGRRLGFVLEDLISETKF